MARPPDPSDPASSQDTCRHHWRIATPSGATVRGVCRRCGAVREFPTTTDTGAWETTAERMQRRGATDAADEAPHLD